MFESFRLGVRDALGAIRHVRDPRELLRAVIAPMRRLHILNDRDAPHPDKAVARAPGAPATSLVVRLRALMHRLEAQAFDGDTVHYARLQRSDDFDELRQVSAALRHMTHQDLAHRDVRLAFWTNLYNVLAIHGVIALGIRHSAMEVPTFFQTVAYRVGPYCYTLDDIENGVLRRNAHNPATRNPQWSNTEDPRTHWMVDRVDPRIHAALVCTAKGCPPVGVYRAEHLEDQLD